MVGAWWVHGGFIVGALSSIMRKSSALLQKGAK